MTLKPPGPRSGNTSPSNDLQREVADRVTKRWEEKHRKELHAARMAAFRNWLAILALCGIAGGGFYAWKSGFFDQWLNGAKPGSAPAKARSVTQNTDSGIAIPDVRPVPKAVEVSADNVRQLDHYADTVRSFSDVTIDYWKNAPATDRPGKSGVPLTFLCLIPDENGQPLILQLHTSPGSKMKVERLSASHGKVDFGLERFNQLVKKTPYLIAREKRAYFAKSGADRLNRPFPFPEKGEVNPSRMDFGALYGVMETLKTAKPKFRYAVKFEVKGESGPIDVAKVGFGESVPRKNFMEKLAAKYGLDVKSEAMALDALLRTGRVRITAL